MEIQVLVPSPGESINEVILSKWLVANGSYIEKDTELAEIESDKATLTLVAEHSGVVRFLVEEGQKVAVETIACIIETETTNTSTLSSTTITSENAEKSVNAQTNILKETKVTPLAKKILEKSGIDFKSIDIENNKRITAEKAKEFLTMQKGGAEIGHQRKETIKELTPLRKKLSDRLLQAKNATAMLTTFNEVDMSAIIDIRNTYKEAFQQKHGIKLGFLGFFSLAACKALHEFPVVNTRLNGDKLIYYHYVDLGIAVQTEKGLVVPVIRDAQNKTLPQIEKEIALLAEKSRSKKITIAELEGGTFSITNGGIFGSLLATPLLNYPQTAILGMHAVQDRPVVVNKQIFIKPMMYVALSYDHRVLDGKDSILFLKRIKELVENPSLLNSSIEQLLEL